LPIYLDNTTSIAPIDQPLACEKIEDTRYISRVHARLQRDAAHFERRPIVAEKANDSSGYLPAQRRARLFYLSACELCLRPRLIEQ